MEMEQIKEHWMKWSNEFSTDLRATTKNSTIKQLEIEALFRAIQKTQLQQQEQLAILEVGCGNGYNCTALAEKMPNACVTGIDFVAQMIENARKNSMDKLNIHFYEGNILKLDAHPNLNKLYDIVFTDRCIINLNSNELHISALQQLSGKLKTGGYLIILENFIKNFENQNDCREAVNLPRRKPSEFNCFIDTEIVCQYLNQTMDLVHIDDFGSLHDIVLYVLVPMINKGVIDYNHPLVAAATQLSIGIAQKYENPFGSFGQNRLYLYRKR